MLKKLMDKVTGGGKKTTPVQKTIKPYDYRKDGKTVRVKKHKRTVHVGDGDEPVKQIKASLPKNPTKASETNVKALQARVREQNGTITRLMQALEARDRQLQGVQFDKKMLERDADGAKHGENSELFKKLKDELDDWRTKYFAEKEKVDPLVTENNRLKRKLSQMTFSTISDGSMVGSIWRVLTAEQKWELINQSDLKFIVAENFRQCGFKNKIGEILFPNTSFD